MANLKGPKNKPSDWVEVAKACSLLMSEWGIKKMAVYFKVSEFLLRQINRIDKLGPDAKKLVRNKKLGLEVAYHLSRLKMPRQAGAARVAVDLSMREMRQFIHLLLRDPDLSVDAARKMVEELRTQKINIIMLPVTSEAYSRLREAAAKSHKNVHDFVLQVLEEYTSGKSK